MKATDVPVDTFIKVRKLPVVVEANRAEYNGTVHTLEGDMVFAAGDIIIRGVKGEEYPVKPEIFEETYEKA